MKRAAAAAAAAAPACKCTHHRLLHHHVIGQLLVSGTSIAFTARGVKAENVWGLGFGMTCLSHRFLAAMMSIFSPSCICMTIAVMLMLMLMMVHMLMLAIKINNPAQSRHQPHPDLHDVLHRGLVLLPQQLCANAHVAAAASTSESLDRQEMGRGVG